jgi:hypothetical protein
MQKLKIAMVTVLLAFIGITSAYVAIISLDIHTDFLNWNPAPTKHVIPILIGYPNMPDVIQGRNASYCSIVFTLEYTGTLAENTPVHIVNASCVSYLNQNLTVYVTFPQAIDYEFRGLIYSPWVVGAPTKLLMFFDRVYDNSSLFYDSEFAYFHNVEHSMNTATMYFTTAGDYSPTIEIIVDDQPSILYTYSEIKVHVLSFAEAENEKYAKINLELTYALFALSIASSFWLLYELIKKEKNGPAITLQLVIDGSKNRKAPNKKSKKENKALTKADVTTEKDE